MKNEWDLFVLVRARLDGGERELSFDILEPALWTIFSGRPALVRAAGGQRYELSPDFPAVLHEFGRAHISVGLVYTLPDEYRLYFRPGQAHPHYNPAAAAKSGRPATVALPVEPETMRWFLDSLPPGAFPPPARPAEDES